MLGSLNRGVGAKSPQPGVSSRFFPGLGRAWGGAQGAGLFRPAFGGAGPSSLPDSAPWSAMLGRKDGELMRMPTTFRELGDLPNQAGFGFVGVCEDGTELECEVVRDAEGLHRACDRATGEPVFSRLKAWRKA